MGRLREIVLDCHHASALATFWAEALDGYDIRAYDDAEIERLASLGYTPDTDPTVAIDGPGPTIFVQQVPESKIVKNRLHFEIESGTRAAEVARLVDLGASVLDDLGSWTVMLDPEGNEFCVTDP